MKGKVITSLFITLVVLSIISFASANILDDFFNLFKPRIQLSPSEFSGLPDGFSPTIGYYSPYGNGLIGLWQGNEYYISEDGLNFQKVNNRFGFPSNFIPDAGYAHNIGGGLVGLWDNSRVVGDKYYGWNDKRGEFFRINLNVIPETDNIVLGYWHKFGNIGRVTLFNDKGEAYLWDSSKGVGGTITKLTDIGSFGLPNYDGAIPQVAYYYNFNGVERVDIWYGDVLYRSSATPAGPAGNFVRIYTITGISGTPKVGYWDQKRNKLVVWTQRGVFESTDGNVFEKVSSSSGEGPIDEEDLVNAEWADLSLTSVETTATSTTFTYETSNGQTKSGATSTSDKISGTCTSGSADVDGNGVVNALDIQMVINGALGLGGFAGCDVNSDGVVNALDIQMVINGALGIGGGEEEIEPIEGLPWKFSPIGAFSFNLDGNSETYIFNTQGYFSYSSSFFRNQYYHYLVKFDEGFVPVIGNFYIKEGKRSDFFLWGKNGEKYSLGKDILLISSQKIIDSGIPEGFKPIMAYYFPKDNSIGLWDKDGRLFISYDFEETFQEISDSEQVRKGLPSTNLNYVFSKGYSFNFGNNFQGIDFWYNINGKVTIYRSLDGQFFEEVHLNLPFEEEMPNAVYFDEIRNSIVLWYGPTPYESTNGIDFYEVPTTSNQRYFADISDLNLPEECKGARYSGGSIEDKINIVFVPSGFNGDIEKFRETVFESLFYLEKYAPFDPKIDELGVFYVEKEASQNNFCLKLGRFLPCNPDIAKSLSSNCVSELHETIVIINDEEYGGAGLFWPTNLHVASTSLSALYYVPIHELSHILFGFGDEYVEGNYYSTDATSNCDVAGCPKWDDLIGEFEGVSCYPGFCTGGNYYVANENSIMFGGYSYSLNQQRDACCTYKELSGSYPESLCSQFQNNPNLINLDNYCSSQKSLELSNSFEKSGLDENQEVWEAPLEDGTFSTKIIDKSTYEGLSKETTQTKSWQCVLPWNWFDENCA